MNDEIFSYRVARFRERRQLSREDLGEALGVSARYISMIESGEKDIEPTSSLYKLFCLLESSAAPLHAGPLADHHDASRPRRHQPALKHLEPGHDLTVSDVISQIRADLTTLENCPAEVRRTFLFMRDIHIPMLGYSLGITTPKPKPPDSAASHPPAE
jgi:transcriptional regulator with XRE-family HTH domain